VFVLESRDGDIARQVDGRPTSAGPWPPGDCQRTTARANGSANDQQYAAQ